ncbi:MAG: SGNH/GDSL hydrolase family protein [Polyangiaceae bacterium]
MAALSGCSSHVNAPTDVAGFGPGGQGSAGENSAGETSAGAGRGGDVSGGGSSGTTAGTGPGGGQQPGGGATGSAGHAGASGSTAGSAGGGSGPVGPRFIGRFDTSTPASPTFAWSGTAVALRFKGTAIGVTLTDGGNNWFEVVVDDQHTVLSLQQGTKKYALASNLRDGPHDVLLYRRTEPSFGPTTFSGFDVPSSAYLPGQAVPTHRLEVIGDSISAGYGNEGVLPCTFEGKTENHYLTYEALAARAVGAELYTEAWSGIGMLRNYDGATTGIMPERYPRTLPEQTASTWDFSGYTPDVVVINLGTNDFAKGDPALAFQTAYTKFVSDLRGHYPKARFYLAIGPMLSEANAAQMKVYLNGVISARAAQSDSNLFLLEFAIQDGTNDGFGCDYHPTLKTHQKMADKLIATLKADLGW